MNFEVGSLIRLVAGGVHVFRVVETGIHGNPDFAIVEPVDDAPGAYPFRTDLTHAVPAVTDAGD